VYFDGVNDGASNAGAAAKATMANDVNFMLKMFRLLDL
jgi:hypothetical protein